MENQEQILESYKKYDYLNDNETKIKVLVSYIKPSFLFKSKILTPIHLGRAVEKENSKDGTISDRDLDWLHQNCTGDDDFEGNISSVNRRVGFFTGTYTAYKNYEKLGNPEYFGSFGYRRLLASGYLNNLTKYDLILPTKTNFQISTLKDQFINCHGSKLYQYTLNILHKIYPEDEKLFEKYLNGTSGYFYEIYVMKKNLFFDFCKWMLPLVFEYLNMPQIRINNDLRDIGFAMERLTGYYLLKLTGNQNLAYTEAPLLITSKTKLDKKFITAELYKKLREQIKPV